MAKAKIALAIANPRNNFTALQLYGRGAAAATTLGTSTDRSIHVRLASQGGSLGRGEPSSKTATMRRLGVLFALTLLLVGCREVRVKTYAQGTTPIVGPPQIAVVRDRRDLEAFGIREPVRFNHEFGVLLLMGPHGETGWHQTIESIRANSERVRIVAFERAPADGGEPVESYRTFTLWIVPNSVYRRHSILDVVTPEGDRVASTTLK